MADDMTQHIIELRGRVDVLEKRADNTDSIVSELDDDITEMKIALGQVATKSDLDTAVNGLLKSALDAVPGKVAIVISIITACIFLLELILAFYRH